MPKFYLSPIYLLSEFITDRLNQSTGNVTTSLRDESVSEIQIYSATLNIFQANHIQYVTYLMSSLVYEEYNILGTGRQIM